MRRCSYKTIQTDEQQQLVLVETAEVSDLNANF